MVQKIKGKFPNFTPGTPHQNAGLQRPRGAGRRAHRKITEGIREHQVLMPDRWSG